MNDDELAAAVQESVRGVHLNIPAEQIARRSRAIRARRRMPALAGGLSTVVAGSAAAALVLTSGPATVPVQHASAGHTRTIVTAAWTVREDASGTVTIYLRQYANPAGLQQTLRADGINAIVRPIRSVLRTIPSPPWLPSRKGVLRLSRPACVYGPANNAPLAVQHAVVTVPRRFDLPIAYIIHPGAMPRGSALLLTFLTGVHATFKNDDTGVIAMPPVVLNNDTLPACVTPTKGLPSFLPKVSQAKLPSGA